MRWTCFWQGRKDSPDLRVGAVARSDSPPDCHSTRALRALAFQAEQKNKSIANAMDLFLAGAQGLEPWTCSFGDCRSTNWTTPLCTSSIITHYFGKCKCFFNFYELLFYSGTHYPYLCPEKTKSPSEHDGHICYQFIPLSSLVKRLFLCAAAFLWMIPWPTAWSTFFTASL